MSEGRDVAMLTVLGHPLGRHVDGTARCLRCGRSWPYPLRIDAATTPRCDGRWPALAPIR